jgi:hypothetical protein
MDETDKTHFPILPGLPPFPPRRNVPPQIHEAPLRQGPSRGAGLPGKRHFRNQHSLIGGIGASPAKRDCLAAQL